MSWNKKSLNDCKLYLILDTEVGSYQQLLKVVEKSVNAGLDIVQLRDKKGLPRDILKFSKKLQALLKNRIPYIMNDRIDLALACQASGVHLGQDDLSIGLARKILGPQAIIGASCQTLKQAQQAEKEGADYLGFGSVFKTKTKPDRQAMDQGLLRSVFQKIQVPVFAIGGIDENNVTQLVKQGINRIAVCRCLCEAAQVEKTTANLKKFINQTFES